MADRIINDMMAYRSEVPWHGKGYGLTEEDRAGLAAMPTSQERTQFWLKAAKLDWEVQRRMLAMRGGDGTGLLADPLGKYRAIVRKDTDEVFQIATARYEPMQNEAIVGFFDEYCDAGHAEMVTVGAIDGGGKIWALAKLKDSKVGENDLKTTYALLASSHDGTLQTIAKGTDVYVVCWNTLSAALGLVGGRLKKASQGKAEFRMKHSRKWTTETANEAKRVMGIFIEQSEESTEIANDLARVVVDDRGRMEFVKRLLGGETILEQIATDAQPASFSLDAIVAAHDTRKAGETDDLGRLGKAVLEAILSSPGSQLPERKDTLWGCVNGVTYHVDHERGRTQDSRLGSAWFGDGDRLKRDSVRVALEIAGK